MVFALVIVTREATLYSTCDYVTVFIWIGIVLTQLRELVQCTSFILHTRYGCHNYAKTDLVSYITG